MSSSTPAPTNHLGTAGMLFGVLGLFASFGGNGFGAVPSLLGVLFGSVGLSVAVRRDYGLGRSVTGLALGFLGVVITVFTVASDVAFL